MHPVAAGALGGVHRGVGVAEQPVRVAAAVAGDGDADAGRQRHRDAPGRERRGERRLQPEGQRRRLVGVAVAGEDEELVAAEAADGVAGPHLLDQPARDLPQQRVAELVAEGVVDGLEAVEVEHQEGGALLVGGVEGRADQPSSAARLGSPVSSSWGPARPAPARPAPAR